MKKYFKNQRIYIFGTVIFQILNSFSLVAFTLLQAQVINGIESDFFQGSILIFCLLAFVGMVVFSILNSYLTEKMYCDLSIDFKTDVMQQFLKQNTITYKEMEPAVHFSFLSNEVNAFLPKYFYMTVYFFQQLILLLFSLAALFFANFWLGCIMLTVSLLFLLFTKRYGSKLSHAQNAYQKQNQNFVSRAGAFLKNSDILHNYQAEQWAEAGFQKENAEAEQKRYQYQKKMLHVEVITVSGNLFTYFGVLVIGSFLAFRGWTGLGIVISVAELTHQVMSSGSSAANGYAFVKSTAGLKEKFEQFLRMSVPLETEPEREDFAPAVALHHADFSYTPERPILKDASLVLESGKKYALVGSSGVGKSTVLQLITKQLTLQGGNLFLFGQDSQVWSEEAVFEKTSYLSQTPFIFAGTVLENICLFQKEVAEERITFAVEAAQLQNVGEVSMKMEDVIALSGSNLSQGQKQRLALARAVYFDKDLLLLDEMSASLDAKTAAAVERELLTRTSGKTVLHVTHRVFDPSLYDGIYELKEAKFLQV